MPTKPFWRSKTLWTNGLALLGGVGGYLTSGDTATLAVAILGIINLVLRLVTRQALE